MTTCKHNDCKNPTFETSDKCALHCSKNEYAQDFHSELLRQFYLEFVEYLGKQFFKTYGYYSLREEFTENEVVDYLKKDFYCFGGDENSPIQQEFKSKQIVPTGIVFPSRDNRDDFDYERILNLFGDIWFIGCEFHISALDLEQAQCFFQDCTFHNTWILHDYNVLENVDGVLYQLCDFKEGIYNSDVKLFREKQFCFNCCFKEISLSNATFEKSLFWDEQGNKSRDGLKIKNFRIEKCVFKEKFILNNHLISRFDIQDSLFEGKLEFKNNQINTFHIDNTNFEKLADFFASSFKEFSISRIIFDDFVGFEQCVFDGPTTPIFKYTTFLSFTNFRETIFDSGLDLEHANLKEAPNFLNSSINRKKTNRVICPRFDGHLST